MISIKEEMVNEIHKTARKNYPRSKVDIRGLNEFLHGDLVEMISYSTFNKGFRYILVVIDVFSKFVWVEPVKRKQGKDVISAMKKILSRIPKSLKYLQRENGKEFFYHNFKNLLGCYKMHHFSSFSNLKASVVERVNRTLKANVSKYREAFSKGYTPNWSNEVFKIRKVNDTTPTTYLLKDQSGQGIQGVFYSEELQKTLHPDVYLIEKVLRRKGNQLYAKWLRLDKSYNSWVNKKDVV